MVEEKTTEDKKIVKLPNPVTVKKFAEVLELPVSNVITELMKNGIMATINEEIDFETASIIAEDLGFEAKEDMEVHEGEAITLERLIDICKKEQDSKEKLSPRPPIVTILGHVDHGKTTLLDTIRKGNVASQEVGGITQHISAYQVKKKGKLVTFIDTPGHEAFSAMRERGVSIADVAILVVAADDGVRPQTKEVITYLKEKKIPTIVAINKIDKPEANPQRVKQELAEHEITVEEWGGDVIANEISAKSNIGIDDLLDSILLVSEVLELKADEKREGLGVVLESNLDPKKGPVSTVLVKTGTFKVGHDIVTGTAFGRIKRMENFLGKQIDFAGPSTPVVIMGLDKTSRANDVVQVAGKKAFSKIKKGEPFGLSGKSAIKSKKDLLKNIDDEHIKKLYIIVKADVQGSLEAIDQILSTIKSEEVAWEYVNVGVGNITESDVKLAADSGAMIVGFSVTATTVAKRLAEKEGVTVKIFNVIYELVEEIKSSMADLLPPEIVRTDLGRLKVLAIFKHGKKDMIVGGRVIDGVAVKKALVEVKREKEIIGKGEVSNLQQNKKPADEVKAGNECGITFEGKVKIEEGDIFQFYEEKEERRKL
ncbi:MAG: translation initiation factor IF-2 [Candidatus Moranbacteria bacterium]|jgi:translation initiation factor IF-2|nr:translation initiation factor IF-2 [Candidatus Moranbacteria bacterium]MDD5652160.1 translation initiation factor IF-2 [Candidatus Moranbacteria bacterium]MDX9855847.1 translation initiation factor IF-2 [Candidatus Moranbacteria bacterium]